MTQRRSAATTSMKVFAAPGIDSCMAKVKQYRSHNGILCLCTVLLLSVTTLAQSKPAPNVNRDAAISTEFQKHVADYMTLRKKAQAGITAPKGTGSAEKITGYQHELAENIRAARPQAAQGEIFTPPVTELFRRLVFSSLNGPDGTQIRKSYRRAEPIHGVHLQVNQAYPDGLPLQSMPPSLLLNLPHLPKEMEYRFVDHELVLRDIAANLVIDLIPQLTPPDNQASAKR
jgi:hypothetical protein